MTVTVHDGAITSVHPACAQALAWIGTGRRPAAIRVAGRDATQGEAIDAAAALLARAGRRALVVLAPGLPTATYGEAVAIADALGAMVETPHGPGSAQWLLAAQRRGRPGATLGEPRHRADVIVYWGVDPAAGWPRFAERYAEGSRGLHAPSRTVIGVHIGADRAPEQGDLHLALRAEDEPGALAAMRAALRGGATAPATPVERGAADLARRLAQAAYVLVVAPVEPADPARSPDGPEALIALAQQLNGPTSRCALTLLRPGGNVAGIESLLAWQTGFPFAVDFAGGAPAYRPAARGATVPEVAAALVVGDLARLPAAVREAALRVPHVVIGPDASGTAPTAAATVDTGVAGLHEAGTAYRMDDVPLPVDAPLTHPHRSGAVLGALRAALAGTGVPA